MYRVSTHLMDRVRTHCRAEAGRVCSATPPRSRTYLRSSMCACLCLCRVPTSRCPFPGTQHTLVFSNLSLVMLCPIHPQTSFLGSRRKWFAELRRCGSCSGDLLPSPFKSILLFKAESSVEQEEEEDRKDV